MDAERSRLNDSRASFIAYVSKGSIARGKAFVANPKKVVTCTECHGKELRGAAQAPHSTLPVPSLRDVRQPTSFASCTTFTAVPDQGQALN
jgi:hypothetical protein